MKAPEDKRRSFWTKSTFETSDLLLAVIAGALLESALRTPATIFEITLGSATVVIVFFALILRFRRSMVKKLGKPTLRGVRWVLALLAGSFFAGGYTIFTISWPVGLIVLGVYFGFIASVMNYVNIVEELYYK
jgi:hypothetical protein